MEKVAVAILNYNGEQYLKQFLPGFLSHSSDYQVYVIDNQSTDGSIATLENDFPQVRIVALSNNLGYAGGYNEGLKQIECQYVAIVNSDIEVTKGWLSPLESYLDEHLHCAAVQPKIKSFHDKERFEYAGAAGGFLDRLGYPYCRGRIFDTTEKDDGQYDQPIEVFWTSGACFLIRKSAFDACGGFDADFFAHMEEIDLCWRLRRSDWKLSCLPSSVVYHVGGGTLSSLNPKKTYLNFRNNLSLLTKNLPKKEFYKLLIRLVLDWLAALKFIFEGNYTHGLAVFRAHVDFTRGFSADLKKRTGDYLDRDKKNHGAILSIVWQRYVRGKKRFSELN